jgi:hypothetical protein
MSQSSGPPRRSRFRFLYQFSLRTLLLATAAAALFCNWYFQPKYHEEELAEKELRLRRQMKMSSGQPGKVMTVSEIRILPEMINHGNWSLLDSDEFTLTRGRFIENQATGDWAAWYPTGGKAAAGKMQHGVKVGRWRTWHEDGTLASEIEFTAKPLTRERLIVESNAFYDQIGCVFVPRREPDSSRIATQFISCRDGRTRAWYPSGRLQYEGDYKLGLQHGTWIFYDEHGGVTETGPFRAGKRHGEWTLTRSVSEGRQSIRYIDGRTEAELNDILARLKPQLASHNRRERYAALIDLADLGEGAAPLLLDRLTSGDSHEQAVILGAVPRMPTGLHLLLPRVRELVTSRDQHVAHQARLTLFQLAAESRDKLFERLLSEAIAVPTVGQCLEELTILYRAAETRQEVVFALLMELSQRRDDVDRWVIAEAVGDLGGNVTDYLIAACRHHDATVRLQGITTIHQFERRWVQGRSYIHLNKDVKETLLARLKKDSSAEVRQVAEDITAFPTSVGGIISVRNSTGIPP